MMERKRQLMIINKSGYIGGPCGKKAGVAVNEEVPPLFLTTELPREYFDDGEPVLMLPTDPNLPHTGQTSPELIKRTVVDGGNSDVEPLLLPNQF